MLQRKESIYEKYIKRIIDFVLSISALIVLSPIILVVAIMVRIKLGSPIFFKQPRPGKNGKIFQMYKFRSMTDEKDDNGNLLSDEVRLTSFGKKLRSTSLDELPELINIVKGDMSIVGPRPQLVRDMVFMTPIQNTRHDVRQGLTGLAQIKGRNAISWEDKLRYDVEYVQNISFWNDVKIMFGTVRAVFVKEGINMEGMATAEDFGDYLLRTNQVTVTEYNQLQKKAIEIIKNS